MVDVELLRSMLLDDLECRGHYPEPGIDEEGRTVYCDGSCRRSPSPLNPHATMLASLLVVLRRDWDVRVLDAHTEATDFQQTIRSNTFPELSPCTHYATLPNYAAAYGNGRDAARHAAALAVWPELKKVLTPEQIADIGECP